MSAAVDVLIAYAENRISHLNRGMCPEGINGFDERDPDCPVCQALAAAPKPAPEHVSMPQYWSVHVCVDDVCIVSIGHDWLSGNRPLEQQDEQTIIGAAQHLLSFVGYGLPPCDFNPEEDAAPKPGAGWVSVEERLPDACFKEVLVYPRPTDYCCEAYWNGERWEYGEYVQHVGHETHPCTVTHWQPMPQPPKEKP